MVEIKSGHQIFSELSHVVGEPLGSKEWNNPAKKQWVSLEDLRKELQDQIGVEPYINRGGCSWDKALRWVLSLLEAKK